MPGFLLCVWVFRVEGRRELAFVAVVYQPKAHRGPHEEVDDCVQHVQSALQEVAAFALVDCEEEEFVVHEHLHFPPTRRLQAVQALEVAAEFSGQEGYTERHAHDVV